jgi:hypothetical protein
LWFPAPGKSYISGLLYTKPKSKPTDALSYVVTLLCGAVTPGLILLVRCRYNFWGRYQDDSMKTPGVCDFKFDADLKTFTGEYSWSESCRFARPPFVRI